MPREFVEWYQRARLVMALAELAHESGVVNLTASRVIERAGLSRKTFYELFAGKEECMEFAGEDARKHLFDPVKTAYASRGT